MKKKIMLCALGALLTTMSIAADGWPQNYPGVMLQGFSWDSYVDTQWPNLEKQADELAEYFSLIWVPQSGNCNSSHNQMGYMPVYWYDHNSSFGSEAQLRKMINTFQSKGVGIIEDVVINHRNNLGVNGSWVDYPAETYMGQTWQLLPTDICRNDDGGKTLTWATNNGLSLSANNDTGDGWDGCRDLDHKSENVQKNVKSYLSFLLDDLGYIGFRYDMTKGYAPAYTGLYNSEINPQFSVGEYWDGNYVNLQNWLNGTRINGKIQSAAFDFATRYSCRDAFNNNQWSRLSGTFGLAATGYRQYAVTFVENHDTQVRSATEQQDPIKKNIAAANAFILGMPGTPCVFLPHWKDYKEEIKNMILIRQMLGIHNQSQFSNFSSDSKSMVYEVVGDNGSMLLVSGNYNYTGTDYVKAISGENYAYWVKSTANMPWVDKPSGNYEGANLSVKLTALSGSSSTLVYTTDGSTPSKSSTRIESGKSLVLEQGTITLSVGLLVDDRVENVITRNYTVKVFEPYIATVYLKEPDWSDVYFYAWANSVTNTQLLGAWPGTRQTQTINIGGNTFYYCEFNVNTSDYTFNIIFNQGQGKDQTVDIGPINHDVFYEIGNKIGGKYTVNEISEGFASDIPPIITETSINDNAIYDLMGRRLSGVPSKGFYIQNGKKFLVK